MPVAEERLLTVDDVAKKIGASPETVRRWLRDGKLQGLMPGGPRLGWRVEETELRRFLHESKRDGA